MADPMAVSINVDFASEAISDLLPSGEIMEVLEDDNRPLNGAGAVGHTVEEDPMAAINSGLELPLPAAIPPPATIAKVKEEAHTFLCYVATKLADGTCTFLGWILRRSGSGSLISRGGVRDFATKLPDGQEIVVLEIHMMEEVMMFDWVRNTLSRLRRRGWEFFSLSDTHGWVFKHDCVLVKIAEWKWLKTEKGGESSQRFRPCDDGGIQLEVVEGFSHPKEMKDKGDIDSGRYSVRFTAVIRLGKGKEKLTVGKLKQLFKSSCGLDYNIFSANCWQFAFSSVYNVLKWNLENSEDEEVRGLFRQKLEEIKRLERPMLKDICLALWNPSAPGSEQIIVTYLQKLEGISEGLPSNAIVRRFLVKIIQKFVEWRAPKRGDVADDGESASLLTSSDAKLPRTWEPSVGDEDGDHSIPVDEEYTEMMQEVLQPKQYVSFCSPPASTSTMYLESWMCTTSSLEPLLTSRQDKAATEQQ